MEPNAELGAGIRVLPHSRTQGGDGQGPGSTQVAASRSRRDRGRAANKLTASGMERWGWTQAIYIVNPRSGLEIGPEMRRASCTYS